LAFRYRPHHHSLLKKMVRIHNNRAGCVMKTVPSVPRGSAIITLSLHGCGRRARRRGRSACLQGFPRIEISGRRGPAGRGYDGAGRKVAPADDCRPGRALGLMAGVSVGAHGNGFTPLAERICRIELTIAVLPTPGPPVMTSTFAVNARRQPAVAVDR